MRDDPMYGDEDDGGSDDGGFGEVLDGLAGAVTIGPSPMAAVMRDGRSLRKRRRAAFVAGAATLAVVPVAAVAAFGAGSAGGGMAARPASAASSSKSTASSPVSSPAVPLAEAGDQIDSIAEGTAGGKRWVLWRDRYALASVPGLVAADSPAPEKHLPVSDLLNGKAAAQCERMAFVFDGQNRDQVLAQGGGCGAVDPAHPAPDIAGLYDAGWSRVRDDVIGFSGTGDASPEFGQISGVLINGSVDASTVATVSITSDYYGDLPPQPVFRVGGERTGYFAWVLPGKRMPGYDQKFTMVVHAFDANGHEIGRVDQGSDIRPTNMPSPPAGTSSGKK